MLEDDIMEICSRAGIAIATASLGVGRELTYLKGPARIVVVHLTESDIPETLRKVLAAVMALEPQWFMLNRDGLFRAATFTQSEIPALLDALIRDFSKVSQQFEDQYILGTSGNILVSYDHHLLQDGLSISVNDVTLAGTLLGRLNEIGAELELYAPLH